MAERLLDVRGLSCPLPVLKAQKALKAMPPGERLRVLATDPKAVEDFDAFCAATGHRLVESDTGGEVLTFVLERRR
jgi:tRNA 2-thiouridine synthesizing protein A